MSFYSAFPSSPLSRSALASGRNDDQPSETNTWTKARKPYGKLGSLMAPDPLRPDLGSALDDLDRELPGSPLGLAADTPRRVSGPARLMRSPFTPAWSLTPSTPFDDTYNRSPPLPSSSFSRSINTRRRSSGYSISASSPTPNFGSLVGSFQESLLRGRMSMPASKPLIFDAEIGVLGIGKCKPSLRCPPHVHVKFPAHFYDFHAIDAPASAVNTGSTAALGSPYVGTIDLEAHYHNQLLTKRMAALGTSPDLLADRPDEPTEIPSFPGYAVPPKGQVQLIVKYPDLNAVKLFLVPYDLTDMQPGTKTFVRQKTVVRPAPARGTDPAQSDANFAGSRSPSSSSLTSAKEALRFAVHLQFCCPPVKPQHDDRQAGFDGSDPHPSRFRPEVKKSKQAKSPKIYLHKSIRLVFAARALDSGEKLVDHVETPGQGMQRFSSYTGPEEEWLQLHREAKSARHAAEQFKAASPSRTASPPTAPRMMRDGLGIAIHGSNSHQGRSTVDDEAEDSLTPLNSDPNGERWQGGSSFAQHSTSVRSQVSDGAIPSASAWSLSSGGSSFGRPSPRWSSTRQDSDGTHQLAQVLASSHLSKSVEPLDTHQGSRPPLHAAAGPRRATVGSNSESKHTGTSHPNTQPDAARPTESLSSTSGVRSISPNPASTGVRPSRIRSASTAGLSEARIQNVSAIGRLEESATHESPSTDSPLHLRHQVKPSLLRKLSEQFARSHTPSPTASPRLRPSWRQAESESEDELLPMAISDAIDAMHSSTGSIR